MFDGGAQFVDSIQALPSLVLAIPPASADGDSLCHAGRIEAQRVHDRDHDAVTLLPLLTAKIVEYLAAVHDFQRQTTIGPQDSSRFPKNALVLVLCVEKAERVQDGRTAGGLASKWQAPHVAPNPADVNPQCVGELSRAVQKRSGRVETNDVDPAFSKSEGMPAMTTPDVNDARDWRQLEEVRKLFGLTPYVIGRGQESPALAVAALEVLVSPIRHIWDSCALRRNVDFDDACHLYSGSKHREVPVPRRPLHVVGYPAQLTEHRQAGSDR